MPKSTIKADKNGRLYVRINGGVYRPEIAKFEYYHPDREADMSHLAAGDIVMVRNVNQSPFAKVIKEDKEVLWGNHGYYIDSDLDISELWDPAPQRVSRPGP